jgi:hypothetical protein
MTSNCIPGPRTVAGLKFDVEGHEFKVLSDAADAKRDRRIRFLPIEWNDLAVRAPIAERVCGSGYELCSSTRGDEMVSTNTEMTDADVFAAAPGVTAQSSGAMQ